MSETAHIHRLAYFSSASRVLSQDDLNDILSVAQARNAADHITGMLLFHDGSFFQVLEGEQAVIAACYDRIRRDLRHTGCLKMLDQPSVDRFFPDWAMGFVPFADLDDFQTRSFFDLHDIHERMAQHNECDKEPVRVLTDVFINSLMINILGPEKKRA